MFELYLGGKYHYCIYIIYIRAIILQMDHHLAQVESWSVFASDIWLNSLVLKWLWSFLPLFYTSKQGICFCFSRKCTHKLKIMNITLLLTSSGLGGLKTWEFSLISPTHFPRARTAFRAGVEDAVFAEKRGYCSKSG